MNYFLNKSVLIISTEGWSHIPISKHHYSSELTKVGARVYFLNPPSNQNTIEQHESIKNLFIINYATIRGINFLPKFLRNFLNKRLIRKIKINTGAIDVVWSFDPYRFQNLNLFEASLKIYHPVDVHIHKGEQEAAQTADLIFSVSDLILKNFARFAAIKTKINHGLQSQFTNPPPIQSKYVKNVGYVGNLNSRSIDIKTLLKIVDDNSNLNFIFIGPYSAQSSLACELLTKKNCRLLGRVISEELPVHFSTMDLFLICYVGSKKANNSNNHKMLEYLSTGKPVVANYTDEYRDKKELIIMSENNDELPVIFKSVVNNLSPFIEPTLVNQRIEFAKSNTYEAHVNHISELAERAVKKKQL